MKRRKHSLTLTLDELSKLYQDALSETEKHDLKPEVTVILCDEYCFITQHDEDGTEAYYHLIPSDCEW